MNQEINRVISVATAIIISWLAIIFCFHNLIPFNYGAPQSNYFYKTSPFLIANQLAGWDGQWYMYLADHWYFPNQPGDPGPSKFLYYPLYPLLTKIVSFFVRDVFLSGALVSLFSLLTGSIIFYRLCRTSFDQQTSFRALVFFLVQPGIIFFLSDYNMSLFFLLSTSSFLCAQKRQWTQAALLISLSILTKPQGILLLPSIFIEAAYDVKQKGLNFGRSFRQLIPLCLMALGPILFVINQGFSTHNWLAFTKNNYVQIDNQNKITSPMSLKNLGYFIRNDIFGFQNLPTHQIFYSKINVILILLNFILLLPMLKKLNISWTIYSILCLFVPLLTGTGMSTIRNLSISFPVFVILAALLKSESHRTAYLLLSVGLATIFLLRFINWYWVS